MRLALANETDAAAAHSKSVLDGPHSESLLGFVLTVGPVPVHTEDKGEDNAEDGRGDAAAGDAGGSEADLAAAKGAVSQ